MFLRFHEKYLKHLNIPHIPTNTVNLLDQYVLSGKEQCNVRTFDATRVARLVATSVTLVYRLLGPYWFNRFTVPTEGLRIKHIFGLGKNPVTQNS